MSFADEVLRERALLALTDPEGEAETVAPLSQVRARQILLEYEERRAQVAPTAGGLRDRELLERLGADLSRGKGRLRCPAHQSKSLSLSWRYENGKALVHCFAGCTFDEIRAAA